MKPLPILAFLVTAAIGWTVGGNFAKPANAATAARVPAARERGAARPSRQGSGPGEIARRQLAAIRASRDPAMRMRATVDLANSLSPAEFAAWMDGGWFDIRGGAELTLFTKIIQERWRTEDAEGLVLWAMKNQSSQGNTILEGWAATDPQRVLGFFKDHPNDAAEIQLLSAMAKTDPATALRRLQEMAAAGISRNDQSYLSMLVQQLARRSPAALEAALDSLPGNMKTQAEIFLIGDRMKGSFDAELAKLLDRPDGAKLLTGIMRANRNEDSPESEAIRDKLLAGLSDLPLTWLAAIASNPYGFVTRKNAERWLDADLEGAGFTDEQAKRIRSESLGQLYGKPDVALKYLATVEMDENNRRNLISNIFGNLRDKPEKAASLAALLASEEDRKYALERAAGSSSSENPKIETPADWLGGIAAVTKENSGDTYRFYSTAREWDQTKLAELSRQFDALPDETKRAVAQNLTKNGWSDKQPLEAEAIRFLVSHPAAEARAGTTPDPFDPFANPNQTVDPAIRLASTYVGKIARDDPAAAGDWIASLPAGDPKLWAQKNLKSIWSQYDPSAADQWFQSLPAADRNAIGNLKK